MAIFQHTIGLLLALFLLVGRWTPARLDDHAGYSTILFEPRLWTVLAIVLLTLLVDQHGQRLPISSQQKAIKSLTGLFLVFLGYIMITAFWSPVRSLAFEKCYEVGLILVVVYCLYANLRGPHGEKLRFGFWLGLVSLSLGMAFLALVASIGNDRMSVLGGGPIVFARNMGLMVLGALYLQPHFKVVWGPLWLVIGACGGLLILLSGSRGPSLSILVAVFVYLLFDRRNLRSKSLIVPLAAGIACYVLQSTQLGHRVQDVFAHRILELTIEQQYTSGRDDLYYDAFALAQDYPIFGYGLAGFRHLRGIYAHNIFLEIGAETGLVGIGLFSAILVTAGAAVLRNRRGLNGATFAAFVHVFIAAQFSGNVFDSRGVFLLLPLVLIPETTTRGLAQDNRATPYFPQNPLLFGKRHRSGDCKS